jgi:hypothetical protein
VSSETLQKREDHPVSITHDVCIEQLRRNQQ